MQNALENWKFVSLLFLGVCGGLQISSTFLWIQGWDNPLIQLFSQSLDLPFLFAALAFGVAHLTLTAEHVAQKGSLMLKTSGALGLCILGVTIALNLLFQDVQLF